MSLYPQCIKHIELSYMILNWPNLDLIIWNTISQGQLHIVKLSLHKFIFWFFRCSRFRSHFAFLRWPSASLWSQQWASKRQQRHVTMVKLRQGGQSGAGGITASSQVIKDNSLNYLTKKLLQMDQFKTHIKKSKTFSFEKVTNVIS